MSLYESAIQDGCTNKTYIDMQHRNLWGKSSCVFFSEISIEKKTYLESAFKKRFWQLWCIVWFSVNRSFTLYNELKNKMAAIEVFRSTKDPSRKMF